jgi:hypothetical protein
MFIFLGCDLDMIRFYLFYLFKLGCWVMNQIEVLFHVRLHFLLYSIILNTALLLNKSNQSSKLSNFVFVSLQHL